MGRSDAQQFAGECEAGLTSGAGEQAVVTDAMEAAREDVEQEAADELVGRERHGALALDTIAAIVLVAEGDSGLVAGDQAAVRDGNPVRVARQVGEHRLGSGEGRLGIDHPALAASRLQMTQEGASVGQVRHRSEEGEPTGVVQRDQPGQEQTAEQLAQYSDWEKEGRRRRSSEGWALWRHLGFSAVACDVSFQEMGKLTYTADLRRDADRMTPATPTPCCRSAER